MIFHKEYKNWERLSLDPLKTAPEVQIQPNVRRNTATERESTLRCTARSQRLKG